jgi:hypothetical protein
MLKIRARREKAEFVKINAATKLLREWCFVPLGSSGADIFSIFSASMDNPPLNRLPILSHQVDKLKLPPGRSPILIADGGVGQDGALAEWKTRNRLKHVRSEIIQIIEEYDDLKMFAFFLAGFGGTGSGALIPLLELLSQYNIPIWLLVKVADAYRASYRAIGNINHLLEGVERLWQTCDDFNLSTTFVSDASESTFPLVNRRLANTARAFFLAPLSDQVETINVVDRITDRCTGWSSTVIHESVSLTDPQADVSALENKIRGALDRCVALTGIKHRFKEGPLAGYGVYSGPAEIVDNSIHIVQDAIRGLLAAKSQNVNNGERSSPDCEIWRLYDEGMDKLEVSVIVKGVEIKYPKM